MTISDSAHSNKVWVQDSVDGYLEGDVISQDKACDLVSVRLSNGQVICCPFAHSNKFIFFLDERDTSRRGRMDESRSIPIYS
jgi:hypothetical protein